MSHSYHKGLALYYERVSTTHTDQDESMENQRALAASFLKRHPEIELAESMDTYSERVSGKSDERTKYKEMLKRLEKGDIRYVLVKDFKRLNRSTELSAQLSNYSKKYGFQFILLSTGQLIDPNSEQSRMTYGFESLLNQEVVYRQSEYARLAQRQKCEAKRLNRNNITFGYRWDSEHKEIVIDEEQAGIVREIFNRYVFRGQGILEIRKFMASIGYPRSAHSVSRYLTETAYVGIFHLNKKGSELGVGAGQKTKRFFNPQEEWIAVDRPDLRIIEQDIFDLAQQIREYKMQHHNPAYKIVTDEDTGEVIKKIKYKQGRFQGTHLFSAKIFCAECGYPFVRAYADRKGMVAIYRDSFKTRTRDPNMDCLNTDYKRLYETDLIQISIAAINGVIEEKDEAFDELLDVIEEALQEERRSLDLQKKRAALHKRHTKLEKEASAILSKFAHASDELLADLNSRYNELKAQMRQTKEEEKLLLAHDEGDNSLQEKMKQIAKEIESWRVVDESNFTRDLVNAMIDRMKVHKNGILELRLMANKTLEYEIPNLKGMCKEGISPSLLSTWPKLKVEQPVQQIMEALRKSHTVDLKMFSFIYTEEKQIRHKKPIEVVVEITAYLAGSMPNAP